MTKQAGMQPSTQNAGTAVAGVEMGGESCEVAAVEVFVRAVYEQVRTVPRRLDITSLVDELRASLGVRLPVTQRQAETLSQTHASTLEQATPMAAVYSTQMALELLLATADREAVRLDATPLRRAQAELAEVEAQQVETGRGLERAVLDGDVEEVLRLRTEAEVLIPARLAHARVGVAEQQLAMAEAVGSAPEQRRALAAQRAERAQVAVGEAQQRVEQAVADAGSAAWWATFADGTQRRLVADVARLAEECDSLRAAADLGHADRLRKLAGLPEAPIGPESAVTSAGPGAMEAAAISVSVSRQSEPFVSVDGAPTTPPARFGAHEVLNQIEGA